MSRRRRKSAELTNPSIWRKRLLLLGLIAGTPALLTDSVHYVMRQESVSSITHLERTIQADRAGDFEKSRDPVPSES